MDVASFNPPNFPETLVLTYHLSYKDEEGRREKHLIQGHDKKLGVWTRLWVPCFLPSHSLASSPELPWAPDSAIRHSTSSLWHLIYILNITSTHPDFPCQASSSYIFPMVFNSSLHPSYLFWPKTSDSSLIPLFLLVSHEQSNNNNNNNKLSRRFSSLLPLCSTLSLGYCPNLTVLCFILFFPFIINTTSAMVLTWFECIPQGFVCWDLVLLLRLWNFNLSMPFGDGGLREVIRIRQGHWYGCLLWLNASGLIEGQQSLLSLPCDSLSFPWHCAVSAWRLGLTTLMFRLFKIRVLNPY